MLPTTYYLTDGDSFWLICKQLWTVSQSGETFHAALAPYKTLPERPRVYERNASQLPLPATNGIYTDHEGIKVDVSPEAFHVCHVFYVTCYTSRDLWSSDCSKGNSLQPRVHLTQRTFIIVVVVIIIIIIVITDTTVNQLLVGPRRSWSLLLSTQSIPES